jgi:hypothetical protein
MANSLQVADLAGKMTDLTISTDDTRTITKPCYFLNLPRELRDKIYATLLIVPEHERYWIPPRRLPGNSELVPVPENEITPEMKEKYRRPKRALELYENRTILEHPALLATCKQIREEADLIYWGKNEWRIHLDAKDKDAIWQDGDEKLEGARKEFAEWVAKMGGKERLRGLRDFELGVEFCHKRFRCDWVYIRVKLVRNSEKEAEERRQKGMVLEGEGEVVKKWKLNVTYPKKFCHAPGPVKVEVMDAHIAKTQQRMDEFGWEGEAIMDFFTSNEELWSEWFFVFPSEYWSSDEEEDGNEDDGDTEYPGDDFDGFDEDDDQEDGEDGERYDEQDLYEDEYMAQQRM